MLSLFPFLLYPATDVENRTRWYQETFMNTAFRQKDRAIIVRPADMQFVPEQGNPTHKKDYKCICVKCF